jgi:hypothetical protein
MQTYVIFGIFSDILRLLNILNKAVIYMYRRGSLIYYKDTTVSNNTDWQIYWIRRIYIRNPLHCPLFCQCNRY